MKKGYIAGKLFKQGDIRQRLYEEETLKNQITNVKWYNPINDPEANDKSKEPIAETIFKNDCKKVLESNYIVAELDDEDSGTIAELFIAWTVNYFYKLFEEGYNLEEIKEKIPYKDIYCHLSDIRQDSKGYEGIRLPWGINQFVIGGLINDGKVMRNFEEIVEDISKKEK